MAPRLRTIVGIAALVSLTPAALAQSDAPAQPESEQPDAQPAPDASPTPVLNEESPEASLPEAESLFETHIEKIGGREKVFAQKNRRIYGVFEGQPFKFAARLTTWMDAPDKMRTKISEPAGTTIEIGFDGETAWRHVAGRDAALLEGEAEDATRDAADFHGQANYKDRYISIRTIGSGELLGRSVYIVRAAWPSGKTEHVLFDRDSGLYVGVQYTIPTDDGKGRDILTIVDGYKPFGGVLYPTTITQMTTDGGVLAKYTYRDVEVDVDDGFDDYGPPSDG